MAQFSNCAIAAIARYAAAEHTPPRGRGECGVALTVDESWRLAAPWTTTVGAVRLRARTGPSASPRQSDGVMLMVRR